MKMYKKLIFLVLIVVTLTMMFLPVVKFSDVSYLQKQADVEKLKTDSKNSQTAYQGVLGNLNNDIAKSAPAWEYMQSAEPELYKLFEARKAAKEFSDEADIYANAVESYQKDLKTLNKNRDKAVKNGEDVTAFDAEIAQLEATIKATQDKAKELCAENIPDWNAETSENPAKDLSDYATARFDEAVKALKTAFAPIYQNTIDTYNVQSEQAAKKGRDNYRDQLNSLCAAVESAMADAANAGYAYSAELNTGDDDDRIAALEGLREQAEKDQKSLESEREKLVKSAEAGIRKEYEETLNTLNAELKEIRENAEQAGLNAKKAEIDALKISIAQEEAIVLAQKKAEQEEKAYTEAAKSVKDTVDAQKTELAEAKQKIVDEAIAENAEIKAMVETLKAAGINTDAIIGTAREEALAEQTVRKITVKEAKDKDAEKHETLQSDYAKQLEELEKTAREEGLAEAAAKIAAKEQEIADINAQIAARVNEQLKEQLEPIDQKIAVLSAVVEAVKAYNAQDKVAIEYGKKQNSDMGELETKKDHLVTIANYYITKDYDKKTLALPVDAAGYPTGKGILEANEESVAKQAAKISKTQLQIEAAEQELERYLEEIENGTAVVVDTYEFAMLPGRISLSLNPVVHSDEYNKASADVQQKMDSLSAMVKSAADKALEAQEETLSAKKSEIQAIEDEAVKTAMEAQTEALAEYDAQIQAVMTDAGVSEADQKIAYEKIDAFKATLNEQIVESDVVEYNDYTILALDKQVINAYSYKYDLDQDHILMWVTAGLLLASALLVFLPGKKEKSVFYTISSFLHLIGIVLLAVCLLKVLAYPIKQPYGNAELNTIVAVPLLVCPLLAFGLHLNSVYNTKRSMIYVFCTFLSILALLPFWVMIVNATRSSAEIQASVSVIPSRFLARNWQVLTSKNFDIFVGFKNSAIIAFGATILGVFFSALTAYGFKVYDFKGRKFLYAVVMAILMIPGQVTGTGFYMFMYQQNMTNNYLPLIIPAIAAASTVFFFRQYLEANLQISLVEASRIDGASEFYTFVKIIMPIMLPAMATMGIMAVIGSWNNYLTPLMLLSKAELKTLPMMVKELRGDIYRTEYGSIYLGLTLTALPLMVIYFALSKFIIAGVALGGVKE